ncbi:MAG TPA: TIGR03617 family F420-dependent LLM class oxidoreductase [Methylomirabilota bacterium]|nr:TIGR03617 family F420-dependent LLM class oxidoreductase [Methylomirabilota bacterium]
MRVETLLPLGKVDPGLRAAESPLDIRRVCDDARVVEDLGYDGLVVEETKDDPYVVLALAAQATTRLRLTTAVAMAFPRSPTITAMSAWTIQKLSGGRFVLGLGSQVRGHIVRRFGLDYHPPGPWMRDYVRAVRAVWAAWQERGKLEFESEHYRLSLMVPLFDPGPIAHPEIPIHLAAVNPYMCRVAGEVADGLRPHPVCTPKYIREVMLPALAAGAAAAGRDPGRIAVAMKPLICTAPDAGSLADKVRDVRARVAFYASTPGYRAAFEALGLGDLAAELALLSKAQRWEEMPARISDEVLHTYAVVGTYDEIGQKLAERYRGLISSVEFSIPVGTDRARGVLRELVRDLQRQPA